MIPLPHFGHLLSAVTIFILIERRCAPSTSCHFAALFFAALIGRSGKAPASRSLSAALLCVAWSIVSVGVNLVSPSGVHANSAIDTQPCQTQTALQL